jgi:threonine synthase
LSAVNSINWARLMFQIVYYFYAGVRLGAPERAVAFSVPTGNFGDVFAGYVASRMGLPVARLVVATNENDILHRALSAGDYSVGTVAPTQSPSMDIQVASNFERFLYFHCGQDSSRLSGLMAEFASKGEIRVEGPLDALIQARAVDTPTTLATIRETWQQHGYLLDPHTAVGVAAAEALAPGRPVVCLATAHPAKFPEAVEQAIGEDRAHHPAVDALIGKPVRSVALPADLDTV